VKFTKLMNADGETVGYFSDYGVEMAARREWNRWYLAQLRSDPENASAQQRREHNRVFSHEVAIASLELENIEPGNGDRVDFVYEAGGEFARGIAAKRAEGAMGDWLREGAISIEAQRFLINKYRRPGMSARDSDLGGPVDAAGVLYILKIKAPK